MSTYKNSDKKLIWSPSDKFKDDSNMSDYLDWIENNYSYNFESFGELWDWSIDADKEFWESILEYYKVLYDGKYEDVYYGEMPKVKWFEGIKLSYSEHVFRRYTDDRPAILFKNELGEKGEISWQHLVQDVASLREFLISKGVKKGDVVTAYINNSPKAIISFLAVNSLGAVWSSASPDFGITSVVERFDQIKPKVLIGVSKYNYAGREYDKSNELFNIYNSIDSIENLIVIGKDQWEDDDSIYTWDDIMTIESEELAFERVDFSDPIWVLYSSGTTGAPKAITQSTGGILLEHFKFIGLHNNVKAGDRFFWYSTTGWMMWNYLTSTLLHGATVVLYDGSPTYPDVDSLWSLVEEFKIKHFGLGASFIVNSMKSYLIPKQKFDFRSLVSVGSTGSPLPEDAFQWLIDHVKDDLWINSISGGTDVCSAFVGGNPLKNLYKGEIQSIALGCDLKVYSEKGEELAEGVGEMVICKPMPSMPIYFWGDNDFEKYHSSYFDKFPGVWRHGDWVDVTVDESVVIYGRSDATLNRGGVRIGSSEIYRAVNLVGDIADSLVISCFVNGEDKMIMFGKLNKGVSFDDDLIDSIKKTIKVECSPRHVPDTFFKVKDIPYTISGKKMETPVKKIFEGLDVKEFLKRGSMKNPESIDEFVNIYKTLD
jgi:acetoacetyl-CoA synthetase